MRLEKKIIPRMSHDKFEEIIQNVARHAAAMHMSTDDYIDAMVDDEDMPKALVEYLVPDPKGLDEESVKKLAHDLYKRVARSL